MKICVFSDSHGYAEYMIKVVRREAPALCFFLGDGETDLQRLRSRCTELSVYGVRGNCDLRSVQPLVLDVVVAGVRIYAVHGHQHEVKFDDSLSELCRAALHASADVVLFGHTHKPYLEHRSGMEILNPVSIGKVKEPSYGLLFIEDGMVRAELRYLRECTRRDEHDT